MTTKALYFLPIGFKACGITAKIKKSGKKDLALFYSPCSCVAAMAVTSNNIKAAPLQVSIKHFKSSAGVSALLVNSGNANCMTGKQGIKDAEISARLVANALSIKAEEVLVSSTGIIGRLLPVDKIKSAIPELVKSLSSDGLNDAAEAILTTDTFAKKICKRIKIGSSVVAISGIAKGAGMIAPNMNMATMLSFIFTDAAITKQALNNAMKETADASFNAITIDGCMSTNDTVVVLANGKAGNRKIKNGSADYKIFLNALRDVCLGLAKMIVCDAEGATKFIEINVKGAESKDKAKQLGFSVANSNLFKCAMFGSDPNWGRIAAALGSVPSRISGEKIDIFLNKKPVLKKGVPVIVKDNKFLKGRDIRVDIYLNVGKDEARVYTSDLSYDYVKINADYN